MDAASASNMNSERFGMKSEYGSQSNAQGKLKQNTMKHDDTEALSQNNKSTHVQSEAGKKTENQEDDSDGKGKLEEEEEGEEEPDQKDE